MESGKSNNTMGKTSPVQGQSLAFLAVLKKSLVLKPKSTCMKRFQHFLHAITACMLLAGMGLTNGAYAQCPNAQLTAGNASGCIPAPINFSTQGLPANAAEITWYWSSSDSLQTNNTDDESHTYRDAGDVDPYIIVYDDDGNRICRVDLSNNNNGTISINENPDAAFSVGNSSPCFSDNSYQFTDQSTEGDTAITNWQWTFGDGNSSNNQNPTHQYEQAINGPNIVLQVTDANGCTDLAQRTVSKIEVLEPLSPSFSISGDNPDCPETKITFNNNTPNKNKIDRIAYSFDDTGNTVRTFQQPANGWGINFDETTFTYKAPGVYKPSLTVFREANNVTCDSTFVFESGVVNVQFTFDSSIINNPVICGTNTTEVSFSHTPAPTPSQKSFIFGSLQDGVGPFAPHQFPPNPVERGVWSGTHEYPSFGVKSVQMNVSNICGALDTLYRKDAVIEGPGAAITLPNPPFGLDDRRGAQDQPISKQTFIDANRKGCEQVDEITYVRRNQNGGFTAPETWRPDDAKIGSPSDTFPYQMVNFGKRTDIFQNAPDVGDTVVFERFELADQVNLDSVRVNFLNRNLTYSPGNGIKVNTGNDPTISGADSFCNTPLAAIDTQDARAAFAVFTQAPSDPPYRYRITYTAGDSSVYRPATGSPIFQTGGPQNMHDTDIFKPNCQAPNLVRFTNNSTKTRAFRGPNGQVKRRKFFYIDTEKSDSIYQTFTTNAGILDTLYYHSYRGFQVPDVLDNNATWSINDSTQGQFRNRVIPFDHNLPYLDALPEGQGAHGLSLRAYLNVLISEDYVFGNVDTAVVGPAPDEGWNSKFDYASSFGINNQTIRDFYAADFKDTFREDKNDDLSPWGSDSLNYVWNFADPNGSSCTTRSAWASRQQDALYRQFTDTFVVGNVSNGVAQIPLNLPAPFDDEIANEKTRINVFPRFPLSSLNTYGDGYDVKVINNQATLRIWESGIAPGDSVGVKYYAGDDAFAGWNCNFSTAAAPYHYYDTSGCWQAILNVEDTVTGCQPATATQRIFMGPPRADWEEEALLQRREKVLTSGYNIGQNSFIMDSLGLKCGLRNKAVKVWRDSPVRVCVGSNSNFSSANYKIEQDSVARLVITDPSSIPLGAPISVQYTVKRYALIEGDTFNIKNMSYDVQQKLPEWENGAPPSIIRRGVQLEGLGCEGKEQEILLDETLPSGQCGGTQAWGFVIDTASTIFRKPGFLGSPFGWKDTTKVVCTDTIVGAGGQVKRIDTITKPVFNWVPNSTWSQLMPRNTFTYDTSGCVDLGLWVQSGNCIDTHYYRNYRFIADLEDNFFVLNPDTLSPSPNNRFGPLPTDDIGVVQNSSYCGKIGDTTSFRVGDTTNILISPVRDQERIKTYEVSHVGNFMTRKDQLDPYSLNDSTEITDYDNFSVDITEVDTSQGPFARYEDDVVQGDTVYVLCDSLDVQQVQIPGGGTRLDTTCVDRQLYPERVCGNSAINNQTLEELRRPDTIQTGCGSNKNFDVIPGKVVYDSFPVVNAGNVMAFDSLSHQFIGGFKQGFDILPERSKLYQYSIRVDTAFGPTDTVYLVAKDSSKQKLITDTILTFPNENLRIDRKDALNNQSLDYVGVIEDSTDIVESLKDSTFLSLVKNGTTSKGALSLELRYKPFISNINVDKPGIYQLTVSMENVKGCEAGSNPKRVEVGHYGRFDPEVRRRKNDNVICSNSENDTVFFYNKVNRFAETEPIRDMGNFPRYYDYRVNPVTREVQYLADDNFWKNPKGVRDNPITEGHQYEQLFWDLNGDGYYETKYNIDSLLYVQDLDRDSTFEQVLDSVDVNDDGLKEVVPYFVYDSAGRYDVSMKSIDSTGCAQVMEKEDLITVTGLQAFIDTLPSDLACAPVKVDFVDDSELSFQYEFTFDSAGNPVDSTIVDSVTKWSWEFNDGKDSVNQYSTDTVSKFFTRNDTFQVELRVESATGCVDSSFLTRQGGDEVVVRSGDTLTRNADTMEIVVLGPSPQLTLQNDLQCQPATFELKDSSENVTEWVFNKGNGEEVTISEENFPVDSFFKLNYEEAGTYNMDIEVFGQVPNTGTADPTDSFRCRAPVQDTTLPTYDSNRFKVRVKPTDSVNFAFDVNDLCPRENIGSNSRTQLALTPSVDTAYDSFRWSMGQGDTLLRGSDNGINNAINITGLDPYQFYEENAYDTFEVSLIPINTDTTLCYDTAVETLRTTGLNVELDTLPQPEGEDRPRSRFTFTSESEFAESFDWHFFNTSVQEGNLAGAINNESGYYPNAPGEGSKFETDSAELEPVVDYYTDRGYYWTALRAFNPQGCHLTDTIKIPNVKDTVYDRTNVFTPNGDGTNDRFTFRVQGDQSFKLTIYNRWGNTVYETTSNSSNNECFWTNNRSDFNGECGESGKDPSNPRGCKYCHFWDGTTQGGSDAPAGTYFYKITYQYEETEDGRGGAGDTQTGTVTLIR